MILLLLQVAKILVLDLAKAIVDQVLSHMQEARTHVKKRRGKK